ncbi:MAG: hypothetical protein LUD02_10470 [Tannerellaceae bacterium]|nr:hypothetical protein [Tannerellaceae bacterium]
MTLDKTNEILLAISQGDRIAFKKLFMTWFPKVNNFIVHMIKNEYVAEDLTQDIFIKLWEGREGLQKNRQL